MRLPLKLALLLWTIVVLTGCKCLERRKHVDDCSPCPSGCTCCGPCGRLDATSGGSQAPGGSSYVSDANQSGVAAGAPAVVTKAPQFMPPPSPTPAPSRPSTISIREPSNGASALTKTDEQSNWPPPDPPAIPPKAGEDSSWPPPTARAGAPTTTAPSP
jgi:hypothetical protein